MIETPGHTVGHISYWREADGVLVVGDVLCNLNIYTGRVMLRQPERIFTSDPAANRAFGPAAGRSQTEADLLRPWSPAARHGSVRQIRR